MHRRQALGDIERLCGRGQHRFPELAHGSAVVGVQETNQIFKLPIGMVLNQDLFRLLNRSFQRL